MDSFSSIRVTLHNIIGYPFILLVDWMHSHHASIMNWAVSLPVIMAGSTHAVSNEKDFVSSSTGNQWNTGSHLLAVVARSNPGHVHCRCCQLSFPSAYSVSKRGSGHILELLFTFQIWRLVQPLSTCATSRQSGSPAALLVKACRASHKLHK